MKGLHEVVHRDEQASHSPLRAYNVMHYFM